MSNIRRFAAGICVVWFCTLAEAAAQQLRPPEVVTLQTKDGVQLKATYFPALPLKGSAEAKQVTPVVLLHDYKGTRGMFAALAQRLQAPGEGDEQRPSFAAVTVDLRGHGDSTKQVLRNGFQAELDAARLDKNGLLAMASLDMEAVRSFLVLKNDAGELNLNKLCLVGSGMGANVAANWALQDWAAPALAIGKQGQDVKALVLVSPRWSYRGLTLQDPMRFRPLKQHAAWMLIYGDEDAKVKADVRRVHKQLDSFHPTARNAAGAGPSTLAVVPWPSTLQGDTLLTNAGRQIEEQIIQFLIDNAADRQHPWLSRLDRLP